MVSYLFLWAQHKSTSTEIMMLRTFSLLSSNSKVETRSFFNNLRRMVLHYTFLTRAKDSLSPVWSQVKGAPPCPYMQIRMRIELLIHVWMKKDRSHVHNRFLGLYVWFMLSLKFVEILENRNRVDISTSVDRITNIFWHG